MKPRPEPKREITVEVVLPSMLHITPMSADAVAFIERDCEGFGNLYNEMEDFKRFILFISPAYQASEVVEYILGYNDPD